MIFTPNRSKKPKWRKCTTNSSEHRTISTTTIKMSATVNWSDRASVSIKSLTKPSSRMSSSPTPTKSTEGSWQFRAKLEITPNLWFILKRKTRLCWTSTTPPEKISPPLPWKIRAKTYNKLSILKGTLWIAMTWNDTPTEAATLYKPKKPKDPSTVPRIRTRKKPGRIRMPTMRTML